MVTISKNVLRDLITPILPQVLRPVWKRGKHAGVGTQYIGNYASWVEACNHSTGYDAEEILTMVRDASLKVKTGEAAYERDSVVFDKILYSFPVLAGLLKIALSMEGSLSVLDFGGSLGTSYFQCRGFLTAVKKLRWSVVEQPHFVDCGREFFEDDVLKFYYDIDECLVNEKPNIILLSGVIQYLATPHIFLDNITNKGYANIIIDRTPFIKVCNIFTKMAPDLLTIQVVPPSIYDASIPVWIFDEENFQRHFHDSYELVAEFDSSSSLNLGWLKTQNKGYILRKQDIAH